MPGPLACWGVERSKDNPSTLHIHFDHSPTDEQLSILHDVMTSVCARMNQWATGAAQNPQAAATPLLPAPAADVPAPLCDTCPPIGWRYDDERCEDCPRRK